AGYRPQEVGTLALGWIAATLAIFALGDLGEREHLFMLVYVPFLLLRHLRYEGHEAPPVLAGLIGLAAGAGACFKPEFAIMAFAAEAGLLLGHHKARWRFGVEVVAAGGVGLGDAAHWAVRPAA